MSLMLALGGCASITSGTTQEIRVSSDPDGADCTLTHEGESLGTVTTPGKMKVKRESRMIRVDCRKDGYEDGRVYMNAHYETATVGNIVFLPVATLAMAVDQHSGASYGYDEVVLVRLTPLTPGQVAAAPLVAYAAGAVAAPAAIVQAQPVVAAARLSPTPFDGDYHGGLSRSGSLREIEVRIAGGDGVGTIRWAVCPNPGEARLTIDSSGTVSGTMDIIGRACSAQVGKVEGRAMGDFLRLQLTIDDKVIEFSLSRLAKAG